MTVSGGGYFDSDEFKSGVFIAEQRASMDHFADAMMYGLGAKYAGRRIPYEELFQKPPPPPYGEMSLSDFKKWARDNDLEIIEALNDDSLIVSQYGKDLGRFNQEECAIKFGSQPRICYHIWETINPLLKVRQTTAEEVRARQDEQLRRHQETMERIIRETMERMSMHKSWTEELMRDLPRQKSFTADQRAGIEKARKVKRTMDATDNDGIRANARSALDTLLEKHGITEADL